MVGDVQTGDEFRVEVVDWTGGQIHYNNKPAADVRDCGLTKVHYSAGPIEVEGGQTRRLVGRRISRFYRHAAQGFRMGLHEFREGKNGRRLLSPTIFRKARLKRFWGDYHESTPPPQFPGSGCRHHHFLGSSSGALLGCLASKKVARDWNRARIQPSRQPDPRSAPGGVGRMPRTAHLGRNVERNKGERRPRSKPPAPFRLREARWQLRHQNLAGGSRVFLPGVT